MAPCGHVQRFRPDGSEWQLFCGGLRNPYDIAFNKDGELFTYDADMEYDFGLPWYRPTRVYHLIPGGEYGHREGTGKWPYYYPDSLPPVTDIGLGSPCGIQFGFESHFPEKYKNALFMSDWAWGKVYAVHMRENGASYTGDFEVFAEGKPLNAMDIEFTGDGSMYLITGGNDSQAALYRIWHENEKGFGDGVRETPIGDNLFMRTRRNIEKEPGNPRNVFALPDRFLRFAGRRALEARPVESIRESVSQELGVKGGAGAFAVLETTWPWQEPASPPTFLKSSAH